MAVAALIHQADAVIWDEAPMMHHQAFKALDRALRALMHLVDRQAETKMFGGKTVALEGDFRHV